MQRSNLARVLAVLAALACSGCPKPTTELQLEVHADLPTPYLLPSTAEHGEVVTELRVEAAMVNGAAEPDYREVQRRTFETAATASLSMLLDAAAYDAKLPLALRITARLQDGRRLVRHARIVWRPRARLHARLELAQACLAPAALARCTAGTECGASGLCEPIEVPVEEVARSGAPFH